MAIVKAVLNLPNNLKSIFIFSKFLPYSLISKSKIDELSPPKSNYLIISKMHLTSSETKGGKIRKYDINNESDFFYMIKTLNLMCLSYIIKICKIMDCIDKDPLNDNINDLVDIMIQKNSKDYNFREALLI